MEDSQIIHHITTQKDWEAAQEKLSYDFCALKKEGFIHCSYPRQTVATANRFFKNISDLIVLEIDTNICQSEVKVEKAFDVDENFPHVYGPINIDAVTNTLSLKRDEEGRFISLV